MRPSFRRDRAGRAVVAAVTTLIVAGAAGAWACVEQDEDTPTEDDMKTIKANLLASPPSPKYPVNADLDGKIVYLGLDVDHAPIEPGKDVTLTHYWKVVSPAAD